MNSDRFRPDSDRDYPMPAGATGNSVHADCYVPAAPVLAVMQDQLRFLMNHAADNQCEPGCVDCARLREALRCLLKPFD